MAFASTSLRTRLTLWYVGVLALLLVVYATVVFAFQYVVLTRQLYHDEVQDVITVEGLFFFDETGSLRLKQDYYSRPQSHLLVDRFLEVRDLSGSILYSSPTLQGMPLGTSLGPGEGDKGFDERIVRLNDGTHVFAVSHIHPYHAGAHHHHPPRLRSRAPCERSCFSSSCFSLSRSRLH